MVHRTWVHGAGVLLALGAGGCTTERFVPLTGEFGALASSAAEQQNERLALVVEEERERYRTALAERGADLRFAGCAATIAGAPPAPAAPCRVVERTAEGALQELPPPISFPNIAALNGALLSYANGLEVLAADSKESQAAFTEAVTGLATAIGELDGAVRTASGAGAAAATGQVEAAGTLLGRLGNAYMTARRAVVLKRLIQEADPLVAEATRLLGGADEALDLYQRVPLRQTLTQAQVAAGAARSAGDAAALRERQDALFAAVAAYNAAIGDQARYAAIGAAHARLAEAARSGASAQELEAAATAVIGLAQAIGATRDAFAGETD